MSHPTTTLERLHDALNRHDLEAFVACFAPDYQSEQPAHPTRNFTGSEQVRKNWSALFAAVPDLRAELVRATSQGELVQATAQGDTIWAEWHWHGTRRDGTSLDMRGVTIFGVQDDRIAWGRLYMEETEAAGGDIDVAIRHATGQSSPEA